MNNDRQTFSGPAICKSGPDVSKSLKTGLKLYIKFVYINILLTKITIPPGTLPKMYTQKKPSLAPKLCISHSKLN